MGFGYFLSSWVALSLALWSRASLSQGVEVLVEREESAAHGGESLGTEEALRPELKKILVFKDDIKQHFFLSLHHNPAPLMKSLHKIYGKNLNEKKSELFGVILSNYLRNDVEVINLGNEKRKYFKCSQPDFKPLAEAAFPLDKHLEALGKTERQALCQALSEEFDHMMTERPTFEQELRKLPNNRYERIIQLEPEKKIKLVYDQNGYVRSFSRLFDGNEYAPLIEVLKIDLTAEQLKNMFTEAKP